MAFSDDDLKRLKNAVKNYDLTGQPTLEIRPREWEALLARLEAAENALSFVDEGSLDLIDAINVWHNAAGKK